MKSPSSRLVVAILLTAAAVFFMATYVGDWVGESSKKTELVPLPKLETKSRVAELPQLKLKKDALKAPGAPEADEPTLPPPSSSGHTGTLGNDEIEQAVQQRSSLFQRCWTQRLRENPTLKGNVLLQFEITPRGKVQDVQIAQSSIGDEMMMHCLMSVMERIPFREFSGSPISLTFPLSFE
jgi:TonB family protein